MNAYQLFPSLFCRRTASLSCDGECYIILLFNLCQVLKYVFFIFFKLFLQFFLFWILNCRWILKGFKRFWIFIQAKIWNISVRQLHKLKTISFILFSEERIIIRKHNIFRTYLLFPLFPDPFPAFYSYLSIWTLFVPAEKNCHCARSWFSSYFFPFPMNK